MTPVQIRNELNAALDDFSASYHLPAERQAHARVIVGFLHLAPWAVDQVPTELLKAAFAAAK